MNDRGLGVVPGAASEHRCRWAWHRPYPAFLVPLARWCRAPNLCPRPSRRSADRRPAVSDEQDIARMASTALPPQKRHLIDPAIVPQPLRIDAQDPAD